MIASGDCGGLSSLTRRKIAVKAAARITRKIRIFMLRSAQSASSQRKKVGSVMKSSSWWPSSISMASLILLLTLSMDGR